MKLVEGAFALRLDGLFPCNTGVIIVVGYARMGRCG
jgi:hypothetical protein